MHKYTEYAYQEKLYQGGFIWDYIDQAILSRNHYGKKVYLYGGDMGDIPNDGNFSGDGIEFSALPHSPHELEYAMHIDELPPVFYTFVRCALKQMGVAGDDSWGARTHEEYLLDVSAPLEFSFSIEGVI